MPVLDLVARWAINQKVKVYAENIKLGDGYNLMSSIGTLGIDDIWDVESPALEFPKAVQTKQALELLAGTLPFDWSPSGEPPLKSYYCKEWRITPAGRGYFRVTATFERIEA